MIRLSHHISLLSSILLVKMTGNKHKNVCKLKEYIFCMHWDNNNLYLHVFVHSSHMYLYVLPLILTVVS